MSSVGTVIRGQAVGLHREAGALRRVPMFSRLDESKLKLLAFTSERIAYADGEVMFRAGEPSDDAYVLLAGEVEFYADTVHGEVAAGRLGQHQLVGELGVLTGDPRSATIRAHGSAEALRIGGEMFVKLVTENPQVALDVMRQLSAKLQRTHEHVVDLENRLGGSH